MIKIPLSLLLFLFFTVPAFAESSSNVEINNRVNINSDSSSKTNCQTKIRAETNGKVIDYESDDCGDISAKTVNGHSEIKVNGEVIVITGTTQNPNTSGTPTPTINEDKDNDKINDNLEKSIEFVEEKKSLIETIEDLVRKVFSVFD